MNPYLDENIDKAINLLLLIKHNRIIKNADFSNASLENFSMNLFKIEEKKQIPIGLSELVEALVKSFDPLVEEYTMEE